MLVVVQFAAAQYSPRLLLWFRRDAVVKHAIGSFLAASCTRSWRYERCGPTGTTARPT
jgi:uncharacterized membrane protein